MMGSFQLPKNEALELNRPDVMGSQLFILKYSVKRIRVGHGGTRCAVHSNTSLNNQLHHRKLTWIPKMMVGKRWFL